MFLQQASYTPSFGGLGLKGTRLLLLGVSFKKDIGDARNSPALRVAELLEQAGAIISYSDMHVPQITIGTRVTKSVDLTEATLREKDATLVLVDHSNFDLGAVALHSQLVIDTRDAMRPLGPRPNVIKL